MHVTILYVCSKLCVGVINCVIFCLFVRMHVCSCLNVCLGVLV